MKKGGLNFFNRRNQSLFDTNVQIRDLDKVEVVYDSAAIPESGTAKVRARPTVKHFSTFGDAGMGFPVPTPKVPVMPPLNPQISRTGSTDRLSQISIDDVNEGQILIPPPPSIAPPPPPPQFIPPSPGHVAPPSAFFGEPDPLIDLAALQPPSMPPPPVPPSKAESQDFDMSALKPPTVAPPKPPGASISTVKDIPDCPKFTPPLPPVSNSQSPITKKKPPTKPNRYSSIPNFELLQFDPTTTPAFGFNPLNNAKAYNMTKSSILSGPVDTKTTHMLLQDSTDNPIGVHVNGIVSPSLNDNGPNSSPVPPVKPIRRHSSGLKLETDLQELNQNLKNNHSVILNHDMNSTTTNMEKQNMIPVAIKTSPKPESAAGNLTAQDILHPAPGNSYSPLLNRKLRNLKTNEASNIKEPAASPLALLMAAKQRDKQRVGISRQNSTKSTGSVDPSNNTYESFEPSETSPNTFTVTPHAAMTSSYRNTSPFMEHKPESPKLSSYTSKYTPPLTDPSISILSNKPTAQPSGIASSTFSSGDYSQTDGITSFSFIPPPPEFANPDAENESPTGPSPPYLFDSNARLNPSPNSGPITNGLVSPTFNIGSNSTPPSTVPNIQKLQALPTRIQFQSVTPSPPKTLPPSPPKTLPPSPPKALPPSPPKPLPPSPPKLLLPSSPKFPPQTSSKTAFRAPAKIQSQAPSPSVAESQATLLSILQKKMLEMDPKFSQRPEEDSTWDEEEKGVSQSNLALKNKNLVLPLQPTGLDMNELESKVAMKAQSKPANSSATQQFGKTFIVRPGNKQPITPVDK